EMIPLEEKAPETAPAAMPGAKDGYRPRLPYAVAATVLLALTTLILAYGWLSGVFPHREDNFYTTAVGETKTLTLVDGSTVTLNTDTQLEVDYSDAMRRLVLTRGEAEFQVEKDAHRPFVIFVGAGSVKAVGTAFNVRYSLNTVDVLVTEGTVEVRSPAANTVLAEGQSDTDMEMEMALAQVSASAGEAVNFDDIIRSVKQLEKEEIDRKLAWKDGLLIFDNDRLEDVVEQVTRYTDTKIIINDPSIENIAVGGYFRTGEINGMLFALETSFDIEVTRVSSKLVLLSRKNNASLDNGAG
ncbi:MAG: FecR domain-containing protein, partial [Bacteroidales bacterium]|nr:FecR domain-containing protein [Bacteroidales bacterium]